MDPTSRLVLRQARQTDLASLTSLMALSIDRLQSAFLPPEAVAASHAVMGLDTQLIADGTYFVVELEGWFVGCGGWSRRATLFGGDHSAGRNAAMLDPTRDAARIRAMYTHPDFARRGVGRMIIAACEAAARREGFQRCELAATLAGEPLYVACGYREIERFTAATPEGVDIPLVRMGKEISPSPDSQRRLPSH